MKAKKIKPEVLEKEPMVVGRLDERKRFYRFNGCACPACGAGVVTYNLKEQEGGMSFFGKMEERKSHHYYCDRCSAHYDIDGEIVLSAKEIKENKRWRKSQYLISG